jgi:chemotaxis response regulator CheB
VQRIRVLNINRYRILREGIRALINTHPDLLLVGSSEGADDIPLLFMQTRPNVILMDLNMPLEAGLNALARIIEITQGLP